MHSTTPLKGFLWLFGSNVGTFAIRAGAIVILARLLRPEEFGVATLALVLLGVGQLFAQFGANHFLVQMQSDRPGDVGAALLVSIIGASLYAIIISSTSGPISEWLGSPSLSHLLSIIAWTAPIYALATPSEAKLQRSLAFSTLARIDLIAYLAGYLVVSVLLAVIDFSSSSLIYGMTAYVVLRAFLIVHAARGQEYSIPTARDLKNVFSYGATFTFGRLGGFIATQADNIVVGRVLGNAAVGIYGRAYQLNMIPATLIGTASERVLFPLFSRFESGDGSSKKKDLFLAANFIIALATLPLGVAMALFSEEIVAIVLGSGWGGVATPLAVLASVLYFRTAYKISEGVAKSPRMIRSRAIRQWLYALCTVVLSYLGSAYGVVGVSVGVSVSIAIHYFVMLPLALKEVEASLGDLVKVWAPGVLVCAALIVAWILIGLIAHSGGDVRTCSSFVRIGVTLAVGAASVPPVVRMTGNWRWIRSLLLNGRG